MENAGLVKRDPILKLYEIPIVNARISAILITTMTGAMIKTTRTVLGKDMFSTSTK